MKESAVGTNEFWATKFHRVLKAQGKPLTRKGFKQAFKDKKIKIDDNKLGVLLHYLTNKKVICQVKYPKFHSFYGLPEWVNESGKFKKELQFDVVYGEFKNKIK